MMVADSPADHFHVRSSIEVLHCFDAYLRTTENWTYRLVKYESESKRHVASSRFLECGFYLSGVEYLRSPLQPVLREGVRPGRLGRGMRAVSDLTYPWYLRIAASDRKIDVVHSHFAQVGWTYKKVAHWLKARHVVSFYGWDYVRLANTDPTWLPRLQSLYQTADRFICEGPHGAKLLASNGCPKDKIRIAKLGVEPKNIPFFQRSKRSGNLRLLQIASFREKKGHTDTVIAFAEALRNRPDMHLTLIGASPGEILDSIKEVLHSRGIADKITLLPGIGFDQLHSTMREYQVFIHPSRHARDGDCEGGAPVVLLDAQATGMPIISTRHCDIPEEVVDGTTGILCAEGDVPALARAIGFFYDMDQDSYDKFSRAARAHVEKDFDVRDCAGNVEAIYRELVPSHIGSSA